MRPVPRGPRTLRQTPQCAAVSAALDAVDGFRSAQELYELLCAQGAPIGLTTVYRALQAFVEAGDVDMIQSGAETLYRRCSTGHHLHHLVCRSCGTAVELEEPTIEAWANDVAEAHGFRAATHSLEVFGLCRHAPGLPTADRRPRGRDRSPQSDGSAPRLDLPR